MIYKQLYNTPEYIPLEINTDAKMSKLLSSTNLNRVYKFTGTTGTYTNGSLYQVVDDGTGVANIYVSGLSSTDTVTCTLPTGETKSLAFGTRVNPEWRDLPTGYTQVEYIEFTGDQYILTGIQSTAINKVIYDFIPMQVTSDMHFICSTRSTDDTAYRIYCAINNSKFYYGWNTINTYSSGVGTAVVGQKYHVEAYIGNSSQYLKIDDVTLATGTTTMHTSSVENIIGAWNGNGSMGSPWGKAKLFQIKCYLDDTLVMDYVPCINSDNEYGFYDVCSKSFKGKAVGTTLTGGETVYQYFQTFDLTNQGEYGTYTITSTAAASTQTVNVTEAADYTVTFTEEQ